MILGVERHTNWQREIFVPVLARDCRHIRFAQAGPPTRQGVSSTVCSSNAERLITLSTSAVAVCCCSDSRRFGLPLEQPRVFDGDDGLGGEVRHQLDLSIAKGSNFLAINYDGSDKFVVLEHWHGEKGSGLQYVDRRNA